MKKIIALLLGILPTISLAERSQQTISSWQFSRDSITWQQVSVPHDWAISGPFDKKWDIQYVAIEQNGEKEKSEHTGRSGSLPWIGRGYYRTTLQIAKPKQHIFTLCFDGAMADAHVYVNGHLAGTWAYGYNAFRVDITPYVKQGNNDVLVTLENLEESNRWYPGAGIYRPVTLVTTATTRLDAWDTFFRTTAINGSHAVCQLDTRLLGSTKGITLTAQLTPCTIDATPLSVQLTPAADGTASARFDVDDARLWSPEEPNLYTLCISAYKGKKLVDQTTTRVGIRMVSIDAKNGFMLNGNRRKFKGVCLHHDLGPLGAAVDKSALIRQIRIMKDMGADAIRTSHNMPSTMQMDVCDSMGMMVMAESFDAWKGVKVKNGYNRLYDEWWAKDVSNLVRNHRNHPSIVMWSMGNEIPEQWQPEGAERAKKMVELCHQLDPTRTVTAGCDNPDGAVASGYLQTFDVPGFNYRLHKYDSVFPQLPQGFLLGSETASTISSRGVYKFPVEPTAGKEYDDGQCSSYDLGACWWSNIPDDDFMYQDDRQWTIGQFVWTGFDYLGEPTPYDAYWPSRSSYFGIVDLAGLPKDRYYLYRSVWNTDEHTLHILPHWTWHGREGEVTPVYVYTDYPSAELFVNGKSQGRIFKNDSTRLDRYRLRWNDVTYEPGELCVVAYDKWGHEAMKQSVHTAGNVAAYRLEVEPYNASDALCFIDVTAVDSCGNECPDASDALTFSVTGGGAFRAVCNGDATSIEPFTEPRMSLFHGKLVLIVSRADVPTTITVKGDSGITATTTL